MAKRTLIFYGDEHYKKSCRPVTEVNDHVRLLLDDLVDTLNDTPNCCVLAANQVGILRRLVVVQTDDGIIKLINPVITDKSGEQDCYEACSCVRDIAGTTIRPAQVTVEALNENGDKMTRTYEGDLALCLCHGIDHLDGKFFIEQVIRYDNKPLEGE